MLLLENSNVVTSDIEQETPKMFVNTLSLQLKIRVLCFIRETRGYLKLMAHILHINRWHTKAFHSDHLAALPVVVNVI
jgi:hypothetical protein